MGFGKQYEIVSDRTGGKYLNNKDVEYLKGRKSLLLTILIFTLDLVE